MRLLLDTHALIWFAEESKQLSTDSKNKIESAESVHVSVASYWEISIKLNLKKLSLHYSLKELMDKAEQHGIQLLSVNPEHILTLENLPLHHRDPFDRILISQAVSEKFQIVSKDEHFDLYKVKRVW